MAQSKGLQHFIEAKAAGPAFLIAATSTMLRGATFWSGGAFTVGGLLGPAGLRVFNGLTGFGIAVGAELLASIFGRQWLRYKSEIHEAEGRPGLRRAERAALVAEYTFRGRLSLAFMALGILASTAAGFMFLLSSTQTTTPAAAAGELLITIILVAILTAIGVFFETKADDAGEIATEQARALRSKITEAAGTRVARGDGTPQDIRLLAKALPRREQERFMAAMLPETPDDPLWSVADLADWLGMDTPSGRRQLHRRLVRLTERGASVTRDAKGAYRLPRSVAVSEFAGDFVQLNRPGAAKRSLSSVPTGQGRTAEAKGNVAADSTATAPRHMHPAEPHVADRDFDGDTTSTILGQSA